MADRKKQSGAYYRKRKAEKEQECSKQAGSFLKYLRFDESNISTDDFREESNFNETVPSNIGNSTQISSPEINENKIHNESSQSNK